jgi:hypothetical protein
MVKKIKIIFIKHSYILILIIGFFSFNIYEIIHFVLSTVLFDSSIAEFTFEDVYILKAHAVEGNEIPETTDMVGIHANDRHTKNILSDIDNTLDSKYKESGKNFPDIENENELLNKSETAEEKKPNSIFLNIWSSTCAIIVSIATNIQYLFLPATKKKQSIDVKNVKSVKIKAIIKKLVPYNYIKLYFSVRDFYARQITRIYTLQLYRDNQNNPLKLFYYKKLKNLCFFKSDKPLSGMNRNDINAEIRKYRRIAVLYRSLLNLIKDAPTIKKWGKQGTMPIYNKRLKKMSFFDYKKNRPF